MSKGAETRERIIEEAAGLFNKKGFAGASMSDIMDATGLQKGGIYRHFESKEELAREAFALAVHRMGKRFRQALGTREGAVERLRAVIDVYAAVPADPPVPGGCPILSAAAESDYGADVLRTQVGAAVDWLRDLLQRVVEEGLEKGEVRRDVDPGSVATVIVASLEGGILLTQITGDAWHVSQVKDHLETWLETTVGA